MPIYVTLHPTLPRVLLYRFHTPWTPQDLASAFAREQYYSTLLPTGQTYDVILDFTAARAVQPGLRLEHFQQIARNAPANSAGLWLVRNPETYFNPLFSVALRQSPALRARTHFENCMGGALTAIQRARMTTCADPAPA